MKTLLARKCFSAATNASDARLDTSSNSTALVAMQINNAT